MNRWTLLGSAAALAFAMSFACNHGFGDGDGVRPDASAPSSTSTSPSTPVDGGLDGPSDAGRSSCLDRPAPLSRQPEGRLPCELIPPGLTL